VLERETAPLGLVLNRDKTRVLWPRTSAAPADTARIGFPVVTGSMVVLGTPLGMSRLSNAGTLRKLHEKLQEHLDFFAALQQPLMPA